MQPVRARACVYVCVCVGVGEGEGDPIVGQRTTTAPVTTHTRTQATTITARKIYCPCSSCFLPPAIGLPRLFPLPSHPTCTPPLCQWALQCALDSQEHAPSPRAPGPHTHAHISLPLTTHTHHTNTYTYTHTPHTHHTHTHTLTRTYTTHTTHTLTHTHIHIHIPLLTGCLVTNCLFACECA